MSKNCKNCKLHEKCINGVNPIAGSGTNSKPKYMIVLDYATKSDTRSLQVPSGDVDLKIRYLLEKAGIHHTEVYVTAAIKCPIDSKTASKIKNEYLDECAQYLLSELDEYKPKVIIPAGKVAFQMLSGYTSVSEFFGHDYDFKFKVNDGTEEYPKIVDRKIKCFPMYSPNSSLFNWKYHNRMILSLKKAKKYVTEGVVDRTPPPEIRTVLSLEDLVEFEKEMMSLEKSATDFETTGLSFFKDDIICSGYSVNKNKAWVVFHSTYQNKFTYKWTHEEKVLGSKINKFVNNNKLAIHEALKRVHGSHIRWWLHNGKFDQKFAMQNKIPFKNFEWDSQVADSLIDENESHSLNDVYVRNEINYGPYDVKLYPYVGKKDQKNYKHIPPQKIIRYLGFDVCGVHALVPKQKKELKDLELYEHFTALKMPTLNEVLIPTEFKGVKYDKEMLLASAENLKNRIEETHNKLKAITKNEDFNPNSDIQISKFLVKNKFPFKKYDIPETTRGFSTNKESIKKISEHPKFKNFGILLGNYKKLVKIKGTYIDGKEGDGGMIQYLDRKDFLHANYNCWTPVTSRYSCNKPSLQVFPRPIDGIVNTRQFIMVSDPKHIIWETDAKALEQYIVAIESKDDVLIDKIKDGTDIHSFNATTLGKALGWIADSITYEMFLENCGKGKTEKKDIDPKIYKLFDSLRTKAKTVGFGLNYGKGAESFAKEFGIPVEEVEQMIAAYFGLYKKMSLWREKMIERAVSVGILKLRSGRRRRFTMAVDWIGSDYGKKSWSAKIVKESIERMAMNFPIQGGAHETFERGTLRLVRKFKEYNLTSRIMLTIHDGLVGECLPEEAKLVEQAIHESMPQLFNEGTKFELGTAYEVGFTKERWYGEEISC